MLGSCASIVAGVKEPDSESINDKFIEFSVSCKLEVLASLLPNLSVVNHLVVNPFMFAQC